MVNTANDVEAMYRRVDSEDWDGDAQSDLDDPSIYGKAGEIYRVRLLIGKAYDVESSRPFDVVARSDERIEVSEMGAGQCEIVWPVEFAVAEGRAPGCRLRLGATWNDGGKSFYVMPTTQRFSLTSLGTFTIKKFGYEVSRNPLGLIWGDGAPLFGGSGQ